MRGVQIAIRLPERDLEELDAAVARGAFPSRASAVRSALAQFLREQREREIADEYRRAYAAQAPDDEDEDVGRIGLRLGAELHAREQGDAISRIEE